MNKIAMLCCSLLVGASLTAPVLADNPVANDMKVMGKSLRAAAGASDAAGMKTALEALKKAATDARGQVPPDYKSQAADGPERKAYVEGIDILLKQVADAEALIDAGKLDEAKAAIKAMNDTKKTYHQKLKV